MNGEQGTRPSRLNAIPRDIVAAADYERYARERLDDNAWAYLAGGAADEITLQENRTAFDRLRLKGRVLAEVAGGHTRLELFGRTYAHPIFLAPVAYQRLFHPDGELAAAVGASAMAAGMVVSTLATVRIEEIAALASAPPLWFQLYIQPDHARTMELVKRAEASGYEVLVITVDAPLAGVRNREQRAGFALPRDVHPVNLEGSFAPEEKLDPGASIVFDRIMASAPTWGAIERITSETRLPVLVKGILDAGDALRAMDHGAAGIVVSNHGGRVLDTLPAAIDALPPISDAIGGRAPVLLDGGIRRGTDIFKAIALGATAVLVGRPYIHALSAAGALGVAHVLRILREELEITMALSGCATLKAIERTRLFDQFPLKTR